MVGQMTNALLALQAAELGRREEALFTIVDYIKVDGIPAAEAPEVWRRLWDRIPQEQSVSLLENVLDGLNTLLYYHVTLGDAAQTQDLVQNLGRMDASCLCQALPLLANLGGTAATPTIAAFATHDNASVRELVMELLH